MYKPFSRLHQIKPVCSPQRQRTAKVFRRWRLEETTAGGDDGLEETMAGSEVSSVTGVDLRASKNFKI